MSLPVISSSRYLSCIDSPSVTNTNSVTSPQELHLHDIEINNVVLDTGESASTKGTPMEESAPIVGQDIAGRNGDPISRQELNGYLSEIYFIMQQRNKSWQHRVKEVVLSLV